MDDWGDPWADNDGFRERTRHEAKSITGLAAFADDAQWGDDALGDFQEWGTNEIAEDVKPKTSGSSGDGFGSWEGDWSTVSTDYDLITAETKTPQPKGQDHERSHKGDVIGTHKPANKGLDSSGAIGWEGQPGNGWSSSRCSDDAPANTGRADSVTSEHDSKDARSRAQHGHHSADASDGEESIRPSISISETSHPRSDESPRTSYEEDAVKEAEALTFNKSIDTSDGHTIDPEGTVGDIADDELTESHGSGHENLLDSKSDREDETLEIDSKVSKPPFFAPAPDLVLVGQIFHKQASEQHDFPDPADDAITSTSARKAWYRITRPQTMRDFNSGLDSDNYLRVTWKGSSIRNHVNTIVSRWADEDRNRGGFSFHPGVASTFGWHNQAKPKLGPVLGRHEKSFSDDMRKLPIFDTRSDDGAMQHRRSSIVPARSEMHFGWASSSMPDTKPHLIAEVLDQDEKPVHLSPRTRSSFDRSESIKQPNHLPIPSSNAVEKRTSPAMAKPIEILPSSESSQQPANPVAPRHDSVAGTPGPGTPPNKNNEEDDDEWGEMISSPVRRNPPVLDSSPTSNEPLDFFPSIVKLRHREEEEEQPEPAPFKSTIKPILRSTSEDHSKPKPMKLKVALGPEGTFSLTKSPPSPPSASMNVDAPVHSSVQPEELSSEQYSKVPDPETAVFDARNDSSAQVAIQPEEPHGEQPQSLPSSLEDSNTIQRTKTPEMDDALFDAWNDTPLNLPAQPNNLSLVQLPKSLGTETEVNDPWNNADFSIFESAPAPSAQIKAPSVATMSVSEKADEAVVRIIGNIPDLLYMLR